VGETIEPLISGGTVTGLHQRVTLTSPDHRLDLDLVLDRELADPGDRITVDGTAPLDLHLAGGYDGTGGAVAEIVTALGHCTELAPSFYRPADLPLRFG